MFFEPFHKQRCIFFAQLYLIKNNVNQIVLCFQCNIVVLVDFKYNPGSITRTKCLVYEVFWWNLCVLWKCGKLLLHLRIIDGRLRCGAPLIKNKEGW